MTTEEGIHLNRVVKAVVMVTFNFLKHFFTCLQVCGEDVRVEEM